jgi:hypothetical protein
MPLHIWNSIVLSLEKCFFYSARKVLDPFVDPPSFAKYFFLHVPASFSTRKWIGAYNLPVTASFVGKPRNSTTRESNPDPLLQLRRVVTYEGIYQNTRYSCPPLLCH